VQECLNIILWTDLIVHPLQSTQLPHNINITHKEDYTLMVIFRRHCLSEAPCSVQSHVELVTLGKEGPARSARSPVWRFWLCVALNLLLSCIYFMQLTLNALTFKNLNFQNSFNYFRSYVFICLSYFTHVSAFFAIIRCVKKCSWNFCALYPFINGSTAHCWALDAFQFHSPIHTVDRTPWTGDQPVARPLPAHSTAQTQN
jgi:hypothetical protein